MCCWAEPESHVGAGGAIGGAVKDEVCDHLAWVTALWARRGVRFGDAVQVVVQGSVAGAKLDKEPGVLARQGGDESKVGFGGEG